MGTCYYLVADPDPSNERQRKANTDIPKLSRTGAMDGELFFWARAMFKTIAADICKTRHMEPLPPSMKQAEGERAASSGGKPADLLKAWFDKHTVPCEAKDASKIGDIKKLVEKDLGKLDNTVWQECLKHPQKNRGRFRGGGLDFEFYYHEDAEDNKKRKPCRLTDAAAHA